MLHDAGDYPSDGWANRQYDAEHDHVGTVEVQILLSWLFETATPDELAIQLPRAA